jgi:hypothetical protein
MITVHSLVFKTYGKVNLLFLLGRIGPSLRRGV